MDKNVAVVSSVSQQSKNFMNSLPTTSETSKNPSFTNPVAENNFQGAKMQTNYVQDERQTNFVHDSTQITP